MRSRSRLASLVLAVFLSVAANAQAEVVHGTVTLHPWYMMGCDCGWDEAFNFSFQVIVSVNSPGATLAVGESGSGDGWWYWRILHVTPNSLSYLTEPIETILTVPESGTFQGRVQPTGTYVLRTDTGFWVKFTVRGGDSTSSTIEYFVQTDGTRYFGTVATESTSWGRIKALYR